MKRLSWYVVLILSVMSVVLVAFPSEKVPAQETQTFLSSNTTIQYRPEGLVRTSAIVSLQDGLECMLIDFEGMGNNIPIGTVPGTPDIPNVVFGSSWLSLVDVDAGGNGNFANEPSPSTCAYYLDQNDISITFDAAVQVVEFYYTAAADSIPVTVTALDGDGNLVRKCVGTTVGTSFDGAACSGDPNGHWCCWDKISLASTSNNIRRISIAGTVSNRFGIDNLRVCVGACAPPEGEDALKKKVPIPFGCCWNYGDPCIEKRDFPGTSQWDDCLLSRIEAESGEKVELWCIAGDVPCWLWEPSGHFELRYFFPSGENYEAAGCYYYGGQNRGYVYYADNDSDGEPDCFIRIEWRNLDGAMDDDQDGNIDWKIYNYDVANNSLTITHYESVDGPEGPEPDYVTQQDPPLGPETEAYFNQMQLNFEQNPIPEDGPMGPYPYEPCDLNGDGICDDSDFAVFQGAFESCVGDVNFHSFADFNGDGCVTLEDQNLLFPPETEVAVDIKPTSCPNPINRAAKGILPIAILGTETFDVAEVDPTSIRLAGVTPLRWSLYDAATPFEPYIGRVLKLDCTPIGPDGYVDLTLKFDTQEVAAVIGASNRTDVLVLQLTGNLKEEFGGTPIIGEDVIVVTR